MARLLIEDVTLVKGEVITVHVRFKGGAAKTITLPLPLSAWQRRRTAPSTLRKSTVCLIGTYRTRSPNCSINDIC